jgi:hypothetical protein
MTTIMYFTLNQTNRVIEDWSGHRNGMPGMGWESVARAYARKNGYAGAWRHDDSFILFYMDGGKLRQRTWKRACPTCLRGGAQ